MTINGLPGWSFEQPIDFDVGETYIVKANHVQGYWASMLITVINCVDGFYEFQLDTLLDGSDGLVDGYDKANNDN